MSLDVIDGYVLEGILGRGSTSDVFRARDREGAEVAIKVLRPDVLSGELSGALERRFLREARIRIDHPNVVRTLDAGIGPGGVPYIVLELLAGRGLDARLAGGAFSPGEALDVVRQAAHGLAALHRAGIVHRDVKPANIFCCDDGPVKLLDFGVARIAELTGRSLATKTGELLGTLLYFAPEQITGARNADARSDVWALGAVLHHALSGAVPFAGRTPIHTALAIVDQPHPPLGPDVPAALAAIVEQCLAKRAEDRLPDAIALCAALEAAHVALLD